MVALEWKTEKRRIDTLIPLSYNPRKLTTSQKAKLEDSLEKFDLVEIPVINTDGQVVAGNQRVILLLELGKGEESIDVRVPNRALTEVEIKEYNITSNTHVGIWDVEVLEEVFTDIDLMGLGVDTSALKELQQCEVIDYSKSNREIDISELEDKCVLKLEYSLQDYEKVKAALNTLGGTPEDAIWKLLNLE